MSGTLFVVATPLGNLEDITVRALRVLREVHLIAAEDTRRTARLLTRYGIATPSLSFHQHNVRARVPQLLARLEAGSNVALVTDAGTPGISDPGVELVGACVQAEISVDPLPGASAPIIAAVASGFPLIPLTIFGFPPRRSKDRKAWFSEIAEITHTFTFFESPHRVVATLREAGHVLGERPIMVGRELTKMHQQFLRGPISSVLEQIGEPKGEITIVVGPENKEFLLHDRVRDDDAITAAVARFSQLQESGHSRRRALAEAAKSAGLPVRVLYSAVEAAKNSGE